MSPSEAERLDAANASQAAVLVDKTVSPLANRTRKR